MNPVIVVITSACLLASASVAASSRLALYTFHSPPYQIEQLRGDDPYAVLGTTIDSMRCITNRMGWEMQVQSVPQNRALHGLRTRTIDGYFAVDESRLLDQYGHATAPIALEKWYFYSLNPIPDFRNARIGAIAGSNEAHWLETSQFPLTMTVAHPRQLFALLERGRVDALMLDQRVMDMLHLDSNGHTPLTRSFIRFAPLHLYLTHSFVAEHPWFLPEFNRNIEHCVTTDFTLNEDERDLLLSLSTELLEEVRQTVNLNRLMNEPLRFNTVSGILEEDARWIALAPEKPSELAAELLARPESEALRRWKTERAPLVTEIFVTDRLGANLALSQLTSDYWQGNEPKFEQVVGQPEGFLLLEPVYFDASTRRFQVIVSTPVYDHSAGQFLGIISMGLDIEAALISEPPHSVSAEAPATP